MLRAKAPVFQPAGHTPLTAAPTSLSRSATSDGRGGFIMLEAMMNMTVAMAHRTRNCQPWSEVSSGIQSGFCHSSTSAGLPLAPPVMSSSTGNLAMTGKTAASASVTRAR